MDKVLEGFLRRNLPNFIDDFVFDIETKDIDYFTITCENSKLHVIANNYVSAIHGVYSYLERYCHVNLSWCGNRTIDIDALVMFEGEFSKTIEEKWRVYMNYCTLNYSMAWWDFDRWEREIDLMAMHGINMPLGVVGSEVVWYETLVESGCTSEEALSTVSGPAFTAWHMMTNIDSYLPPKNVSYLEERLELARKILARYRELGMTPIMHGFSGHVPLILKKKYPHAKILKKWGWCAYPKTGQLDPLDPLFKTLGTMYLKNMERLLGNSHYIACDPFHEGCPPHNTRKYLTAVGRTIDELYREFDPNSVWVMQGWTPRADIIKAVPVGRLLVLDLPSDRYKKYDNFYGHEVVAGMLHNFGGKNAMQGKISRHSENAYRRMKMDGVNVVGTGMFMEGIEQNPVVYDLQFRMLTESDKIDFDAWLRDYIVRRYGKTCDALNEAWSLLMKTCYSDTGYEENEVGSCLASRPQLMPVRSGPCCYTKIWYDMELLEKALSLFSSVADKYRDNDGYQYDLMDITRQVLSNRFYRDQQRFAEAVKRRDTISAESIAASQTALLLDIDELLSHRSETCLSRYLAMCHSLATSDEERHYFDKNARALITLWGNIEGNCHALYDYSWREWSGHIKGYYLKRWQMFYDKVLATLKAGKRYKDVHLDNYKERMKYNKYPLGKEIYDFELSYINNYEEVTYPSDSDVIPSVERLISKYDIK